MPWVMMTICDAWRPKKSRVKGKNYYKYDNDAERIKNKHVKIPLEEFKVLLQYWGDEEVQVCIFDFIIGILFLSLIILNFKANVVFLCWLIISLGRC